MVRVFSFTADSTFTLSESRRSGVFSESTMLVKLNVIWKFSQQLKNDISAALLSSISEYLCGTLYCSMIITCVLLQLNPDPHA